MVRNPEPRSGARNLWSQQEPPKGSAWLSLAFLFSSVIVLSVAASVQMSAARGTAADHHISAGAICIVGVLVGVFTGLAMLRRSHPGRNRKAAIAALFAGSVIFLVGAAVSFSTGTNQATGAAQVQENLSR